MEVSAGGDEGQTVFYLTVEGEFESPDSLTCRQTIGIGGFSFSGDQTVIIGGQAWINEGDGWKATTLSDSVVIDSLDVCVGAPHFWDDFNTSDFQELEGQPGEINGVAAIRFELGDIPDDSIASEFTPNNWGNANIEEFALWLAVDGGWPVSLSARFVATPAELALADFGMESGQELVVEMLIRITDVNDPQIRISPPQHLPP